MFQKISNLVAFRFAELVHIAVKENFYFSQTADWDDKFFTTYEKLAEQEKFLSVNGNAANRNLSKIYEPLFKFLKLMQKK